MTVSVNILPTFHLLYSVFTLRLPLAVGIRPLRGFKRERGGRRRKTDPAQRWYLYACGTPSPSVSVSPRRRRVFRRVCAHAINQFIGTVSVMSLNSHPRVGAGAPFWRSDPGTVCRVHRAATCSLPFIIFFSFLIPWISFLSVIPLSLCLFLPLLFFSPFSLS
ncbi:hypothetical protein HYPSUDRAFT_971286 [Hypholoma sublateritium FD-334 SS-4]|uniref:Uncharacterized protein n=1 Tax=Hypholoma sublateritium (strain FD-334 SS-4) TaxID=945553 RepID=A0A0D2NGG2_HYPSF|nr:hypothetical protein HYPSUDRAFT_971286 [Hypholoma sublateritium FD-334 SS-4]